MITSIRKDMLTVKLGPSVNKMTRVSVVAVTATE